MVSEADCGAIGPEFEPQRRHGCLYTEERKKLVQACVTAVTMAGYRGLSEFERGVIVDAQEMGHSISETVDDWKHVALSDESRFQLNRADGRVRVWRQPHESMDPTCQQGTVQAGGDCLMVQTNAVGVIWDPDASRYDSDRYQDNATPHTSRIATEGLQKHSSEFRHFHWPPKSPDMNITEYIWGALQCANQKRSPFPLTPTDLWTALQDSCSQLPPAPLQTLIESMPRRVAALLRARGGPTRYYAGVPVLLPLQCKCIMPSRHGGTLYSRRAASPLVSPPLTTPRVFFLKMGMKPSKIVLSSAWCSKLKLTTGAKI
ncbi:transposable element Tcb2 transposase [Trichonephila clavipes]|nr:transposable element Tcb2 transposase [Trichonephila clavipes]